MAEGFCESRCALCDCESIVAYPIIYRLVPSPFRFEIRQWPVEKKIAKDLNELERGDLSALLKVQGFGEWNIVATVA